MADVESFTLDHTAVLAPYVRLIGTESGPRGDVISNFDLRLVQPNEQEIPTAGLHTIEHLLGALVDAISDSLRAIVDDVQWDDVPGTDAFSCGNYRDHSLHTAKEWSKVVLEKGISRDAFERVGV